MLPSLDKFEIVLNYSDLVWLTGRQNPVTNQLVKFEGQCL